MGDAQSGPQALKSASGDHAACIDQILAALLRTVHLNLRAAWPAVVGHAAPQLSGELAFTQGQRIHTVGFCMSGAWVMYFSAPKSQILALLFFLMAGRLI